MKKEFTVWLTEDWNGHWEGSCLHVQKETKKFYHGMASFNACSFFVKFPKNKCIAVDPMDKYLKIDESKFTPKQKKEMDKLKKELLTLIKEKSR